MKSGMYVELERKLKAIERLYQNPGTAGEKAAALQAMKTIQAKLSALKKYSQMTIRSYEFTVFTKD